MPFPLYSLLRGLKLRTWVIMICLERSTRVVTRARSRTGLKNASKFLEIFGVNRHGGIFKCYLYLARTLYLLLLSSVHICANPQSVLVMQMIGYYPSMGRRVPALKSPA